MPPSLHDNAALQAEQEEFDAHNTEHPAAKASRAFDLLDRREPGYVEKSPAAPAVAEKPKKPRKVSFEYDNEGKFKSARVVEE